MDLNNLGSLLSKKFLKFILIGSTALLFGTPVFGEEQTAPEVEQAPTLEPVEAVPTTPFDAPEGSWTLVLLPDTQYYSKQFPQVYVRQTEWIVAHKQTHNILFVAHEGDIVSNNSKGDWKNAQKAMRILNKGGVPYAITPGNHDLGDKGKTNTRETLMNDYFKEEDYANSTRYALFEEGKMENSWHEIISPTGKFLVLALEFGPRDEVLEWANAVVAAHPKHRVIIVTHAFLRPSAERNNWEADKSQRKFRGNPRGYPYAKLGSVNDAEDMWNKLISHHNNIIFVFNGHFTGTGVSYRSDTVKGDRKVHQILANYQHKPGADGQAPRYVGTVVPPRGFGGGGYLRLVRFLPDNETVQIRTYSPWYDHWLEEPAQSFDVKL